MGMRLMMLIIMQASKCSECGSQEHQTTRCPELVAPLYQTGFFRPAGGRPQGGDDEEEERILSLLCRNG